jgi:ABC-2 type transport system ATP-binding protein
MKVETITGETAGKGTVIDIRGLTKFYGAHVGVKDVNLTVNRGEIMGFLGPNGAGKTTTMRCCLALIAKTAGSVSIFGMDSHDNAVAIRRKTGYLPGDFGLIPNITVEAYLSYLLSLSDCGAKTKMRELGDRLDLDLSRKTNELSKGNRQKVGIVQTLMADQDLVIMDEPTAGLDPLMQQEFYKILREEQRQGTTVFMSSHILAEVETVCDRVAIIRKGRLQMVEDIQMLQEKTGKVLEVEFRDSVDPEELRLEGVSDLRQDNGRFILTVHENLDQVIKRVSNYKILNMNLKTYSLEQLFLKYYGNDDTGKPDENNARAQGGERQ